MATFISNTVLLFEETIITGKAKQNKNKVILSALLQKCSFHQSNVRQLGSQHNDTHTDVTEGTVQTDTVHTTHDQDAQAT